MSGAGIAAASVLQLFPNVANTDITSFKSLKVLDLSYFLSSSDIPSILLGREIYNNKIYHAPLQLEGLYFKGNFKNPVTFSGASNAIHICLWQGPGTNKFKICVSGNFNAVRKLVLSEYMMRYVTHNLLRPFGNADLSTNELGRAVAIGGYAMSVFDRLNCLTVLLISNNQISRMPSDTFRSSKWLQVLDLSQNKLSSVTFKTDYLTSLKVLNMAGNEIVYLDGVGISGLGKLLEVSVANGTVKRVVVDINLDKNSFECSCKTVVFLQWLLTLNETSNCICLLNSDSVKIDDYGLKQAQYLCKIPIIISFCTIMSVAIVILSTVTTYFMVNHRRQLLQLRKIQLGVEVYAAQDIEISPPPIFVCRTRHRNKPTASLSFVLWGGRVVRWCWVNFQCRECPTILNTLGQGPIALAIGAGGGGLDISTLIYPFFSFSLSLGDGPI